MTFRTVVDIPKPRWQIGAAERMLFVGSCFADRIGKRFSDEGFPVVVNPFGVMYNPASILHTLHLLEERGERREERVEWNTVVLTLGTNHVYVERATGEIVDNCQKRPQELFEEQELSVEECADYLRRCVEILLGWNPKMKIILTVSPIRYRKYGFHRSQLSKATLLLAVNKLSSLYYFPAYEIVNDELRDYRFYAPDMLHPSEQAVDYVWERLVETCFSADAMAFVNEWRPIRQALAHHPFRPESADYQAFKKKAEERLAAFRLKWGL